MSNRTDRHDKIQQIAAKIIDLNALFAQREGLKKIDTDLLRKYTQDLYEEVLLLETTTANPTITVVPNLLKTANTPDYLIPPVEEPVKDNTVEKQRTIVPEPVLQVPPVSTPIVQPPVPEVVAPPIVPPKPEPMVITHVVETKPVTEEKPVEVTKPEPVRNEPAPQPEVHDLATKLQQTPIHDLKKAISINKKFEFINQLFKGDHEAYAKSIHYINGLTNGNEAQVFFNNLKKQFAWDEENKLFIELADMVKRRFVK